MSNCFKISNISFSFKLVFHASSSFLLPSKLLSPIFKRYLASSFNFLFFSQFSFMLFIFGIRRNSWKSGLLPDECLPPPMQLPTNLGNLFVFGYKSSHISFFCSFASAFNIADSSANSVFAPICLSMISSTLLKSSNFSIFSDEK